MKKGIMGLAIWLILPCTVQGEGDTARKIEQGESEGLSSLIRIAVENNPGLKAAHSRWQSAVERAPQVRALPDPRFTYSYQFDSVETRVGPQEQRFGLSQTFPWFGKRDEKEKAALVAAKAAEKQFHSERLSLLYRLHKAFYERYYLDRAIAITEDNIQLLKHLEGVAQAKYRAGAPVSSLLKAQVELGKLDEQRHSLNDLIQPVTAQINAALNQPINAPLVVTRSADFAVPEIDEERAYAAVQESNPDLQSLRFNTAREEASIGVARKDGYPNLILGVEYIQTGDAIMPGVSDSGKDPVMAMVGLELPIWRGKYRAGVREAEARRDAAAKSLENKSNELGSALSMAMYRYRDAVRKINLFGDTLIPQAEQALNVTEEAYRSGNEDFLSIIDAQRLLLEFQLSHERARANSQQQLAEIEMLTGVKRNELEVLEEESGNENE